MKNIFKPFGHKTPLLSIIVVAYNMQRELPRTLFSLSTPYQERVSEDAYEVLVVENGSQEVISPVTVKRFGPNFKYFTMPDPKPSPASAMNYGVSRASGKYVGIMLDGARMLSPGVLKYALAGFEAFKDPLIYTLGFHLGNDIQQRSMVEGYNQAAEDRLLKESNWQENGYRLFGISVFAGNSTKGWFLNCNESNCFFLKKKSFIKIGRYDERLDKPGGGICNHDFFSRAHDMPDSDLVVILGEGTFHQIHGGAATNNPDFRRKGIFQTYLKQYQNVKGKPFISPVKKVHSIGHIPNECIENLVFSAAALDKASRKGCDNFTSIKSGGKSGREPGEESLGLKFKAGGDHYRAYVGPPQNYDLIAAMTFNLLTTIGLRQHHSILDIGCGSLRIGRLLIPYLNAGKYTGIEPNKWLVKEGVKNELGEDLLNIKRPTFFFQHNLDRLKEGLSFDFALAQSIFSHCTPGLILQWLKDTFSCLQSGGVLLATFLEGEEDFFNRAGIDETDYQSDGWVYPKTVAYRTETINSLAAKAGFRFQILRWVHPRQTWALFAKSGFDTSWFTNETLTWNTAMKFCPTLTKSHGSE